MEVVSSSSSSNSRWSGGKATTKRLQSELMQLMMSGDKDATAFPQGDNLFGMGWYHRRCQWYRIRRFDLQIVVEIPS